MAEVFDDDLRTYLRNQDNIEEDLRSCDGCGQPYLHWDLEGGYCPMCKKLNDDEGTN